MPAPQAAVEELRRRLLPSPMPDLLRLLLLLLSLSAILPCSPCCRCLRSLEAQSPSWASTSLVQTACASISCQRDPQHVKHRPCELCLRAQSSATHRNRRRRGAIKQAPRDGDDGFIDFRSNRYKNYRLLNCSDGAGRVVELVRLVSEGCRLHLVGYVARWDLAIWGNCCVLRAASYGEKIVWQSVSHHLPFFSRVV